MTEVQKYRASEHVPHVYVLVIYVFVFDLVIYVSIFCLPTDLFSSVFIYVLPIVEVLEESKICTHRAIKFVGIRFHKALLIRY